jgi:hypothetical protein
MSPYTLKGKIMELWEAMDSFLTHYKHCRLYSVRHAWVVCEQHKLVLYTLHRPHPAATIVAELDSTDIDHGLTPKKWDEVKGILRRLISKGLL